MYNINNKAQRTEPCGITYIVTSKGITMAVFKQLETCPESRDLLVKHKLAQQYTLPFLMLLFCCVPDFFRFEKICDYYNSLEKAAVILLPCSSDSLLEAVCIWNVRLIVFSHV